MKNPTPKKTLPFSHDNRLLGEFHGARSSPTVVIIAGIHGNEKAGVLAADSVLDKIRADNVAFDGNLYFILGNINALNKGVRFEKVDLNRIWRKENIEELFNISEEPLAEAREQMDIYTLIKMILANENGPFYFLDLHTTSADSVPFITISDSLNNRKFSSNFPIPIVLGIEEYLDGPLLTFINEFGHVALGFEGGAHNDPASVASCEAFIWKALVRSGCLKKSEVVDFEKYRMILADLCCKYQFFAINYRYQLENGENFEMLAGFKNFEPIEKGQLLAKSDGNEIRAHQTGRIFMPLYQELGEDGFFVLNKISKFWLNASIVARKLKINHFLRLIPGVRQESGNNYTLIVNPKIARFMAKEIFHLFGYRQQIYKDDKLHFIKRDRKISELH
jgi:succinylglutamate desuccinylase